MAPPVLDTSDAPIYAGNGIDRGRLIAWNVRQNLALQQVSIAVTVDGSAFARPALLHATLMQRVGVLEEDWPIWPPIRLPQAAADCWMQLARDERLSRLGTFSSLPGVALPASFNVCMTLGNAHFGLIHLLAGHTKTMRSMIGNNNLAQDEVDEGYRTVQGIQAGIIDCMKISELREIRYGGAGKWLFFGKDDACLVTDGLIGGTLKITTFYKKAEGPNKSDALYWKRKAS
ncbi:MAG: hypothetical protein U1E60_23495 [Reyranellaceae bacterium]